MRSVRPYRHRVRFALAAGKYSVPAAQAADFLARLADHEDLDLIGTTEFQKAGITAEVRAALGNGWQVTKAGEYLCAWRKDVFRVRPGIADVAIERRFSDIDGLPDWQNVFGGIFRLEHISSGRPLTPVPFHSNSGIERGTSLRTKDAPLKVKSSRIGLTGIGRWALRRIITPDRSGAVRLNEHIVLPMGDLNLNQFLKVFRTYALNTLGGKSIWQYVRKTVGDHGNRLIVTVHVRGRGTRIGKGRIIPDRELRRPKGWDHGPLVGVLTFPGKR
jgi:hypothetical protein